MFRTSLVALSSGALAEQRGNWLCALSVDWAHTFVGRYRSDRCQYVPSSGLSVALLLAAFGMLLNASECVPHIYTIK